LLKKLLVKWKLDLDCYLKKWFITKQNKSY